MKNLYLLQGGKEIVMKKIYLVMCAVLLCCSCNDDSNKNREDSDVNDQTLKSDGEPCDDGSECKSHQCLPSDKGDGQKVCSTLSQNGESCTKNETCSSGYCDETTGQCGSYPGLSCSAGQHPYGETCEPDDDNNCGSHGYVCNKSDFAHAAAAACSEAKCVATECQQKYHFDSNHRCVFCESDDLWDEESKTCNNAEPSVSCISLGSETKVGDICQLGRYRQYSLDEVKQPIDWIVIDKDDEKGFLLMSKYVLDGKKYHETKKEVTWETCTLRSWLNGLGSAVNLDGKDYSNNNFIDVAFTEDELLCIPKVTNTNLDNHGHDGGNDTEDQIFVLPLNDLSVFTGYRHGYMTDYARYTVKLSVFLDDCLDDFCSTRWWLRGPGDDGNHESAVVGLSGGSSTALDYIDVNTVTGLRPSLWIKPQLCAGAMCPDGQHKYGETCEPDDNSNCGRHGNKCESGSFSHATSVACEAGGCQITGCESGYHLNAHGVCVTCKETEAWDESTKSCQTIVQSVDCDSLVNNVHVGDIVTFGQYIQTISTSAPSEPEPIEWQVLDIDDEKGVLVISKYVLDIVAFNVKSENSRLYYPESTLRSWLNGLDSSHNRAKKDYSQKNFIDTAFNDEQLKCINSETRKYTIKSGTVDVSDKIIIINKDEAARYFASDAQRKAFATQAMTSTYDYYFVDPENECVDGRCAVSWWLPDLDVYAMVLYVSGIGEVVEKGVPVTAPTLGVRPAFWLKK